MVASVPDNWGRRMTDATQTDRRSDLLALQMDALYKNAPASFLSIAGAFLALLTYWGPQTASVLVAWVACVGAVALLHIGSAVARSRHRPAGWTPCHWAQVIHVCYFSSGLLWGAGGAWMLGHGDEQQALVICCIAMGAVTVTFPAVVYPPAYNLFQVPIFALFTFGLARSEHQFGDLLAVASALLCLALTVIAHGIGAQLVLALRLSSENRKLAETLKRRGAALEVANRELEALSLTDPLTGVANRRKLMNVLRGQGPRQALLIVDIDHFKAYNDSFGHVHGDACLVLVARAIAASVGEGDLVARLGGEEFVAVLADVEDEQAQATAELIRANVQRLFSVHPNEVRRTVTVSIGLALRDEARHPTPMELMGDADDAVYRAKNAGRNRVCTIRDERRVASA